MAIRMLMPRISMPVRFRGAELLPDQCRAGDGNDQLRTFRETSPAGTGSRRYNNLIVGSKEEFDKITEEKRTDAEVVKER